MITNVTPYSYKGFLIRDNDYGKALILRNADLEKSADFIKQENIIGIEINYSLGYKSKNLDALSSFPSVKHLRVVNHTIDLKGLFFLKNLETLELGEESSQPIDFTVFPKLKRCFFSWRKGAESIFRCPRLLRLGIEKYPDENLNRMSELPNLIYLGIGNSKLTSLSSLKELLNLKELSLSSLPKINNLDGVEFYPNLTNLDLYDMRQLGDLSKIVFLSKLKVFSIENCKKIVSINALSVLKELEVLHLDNCGDIESLLSIKGLNKLRELHFIESTKILDGNLAFIKNKSIKSLYFQDRRHYTHKRKELLT